LSHYVEIFNAFQYLCPSGGFALFVKRVSQLGIQKTKSKNLWHSERNRIVIVSSIN